MIRQMTIGKKIGLGFSLLTAVMVLAVAYGVICFERASARFAEYQRQSANNALINDLNSSMLRQRILAVYYL